MAVNKTDEYNWQKATKLDRARFGGRLSPNTVALKEFLLTRYGGVNVGILNKRKQRGGEALSTHYFGAAMDWRYPTRAVVLVAMKYLVANSKEFGIQMIVDYVGGTIWTPKRGWHKAAPNAHGMGQPWAKWIHVESTKTDWGNAIPLSSRLAGGRA
jgi:hypothetical protein